MSLLNQIGRKYNDVAKETWNNPLDSLSSDKATKIKHRKIIKEKIYKLINYGIINESNYFVLKNGGKFNKFKMSDEQILEYIINYHKNLNLSYMIDHILGENNGNSVNL